MIFKKILNKLFYSPYRVVKKNNTEILSGRTTILNKSFRLDIRQKNNHLRVNIGEGNNLSCNLIFLPRCRHLTAVGTNFSGY